MRSFFITSVIACLLGLTSCAVKNSTGLSGADKYFDKNVLVSYDELTMDLDDEPIEYTIDISTGDGRLKLNKLSVKEAERLALIEAVMANRCATLFQPQYTHLIKGGKVLRVTVYGYPARYKKKK